MNKRNSIILGLLFLVVAIEILIFAPKNLGISPSEDAPPPKSTPNSTNSGQVMQDVHLVEAKSAGKEWELWAQKALRPKDNDEWTIERVKVKFFAANGVLYTVTGLHGQVVPTKNDIRIDGQVETKSSNGYTFKTDSVYYDSKKKRLVSPKAVEMIGPDDKSGGRLVLTGADMTADFGSNEIAINRDVRARKKIKEGQTAKIQSEKALFSGRTNQAQFSGNVVIDVETMRITGPEAQFAYNRETQNFESVQVDGGVKVTDTDKFATSNSVNVHFTDDRVVFSGSPRVVQNGDELVGDQIVFLEGGKRIQVSNARAQIDPKSMEKPPPGEAKK